MVIVDCGMERITGPGRRFNPHPAIRIPQSNSRLRFGLAKAGGPVAFFPLAAFLEQFRGLKTLELIPFTAQGGRRAQTTML